jgi:4-hydroxybenzoate polyprenyltransferase
MVALGALAGWFAVAEKIEWLPMALFFVWIVSWEIGGRNIVNDWADVEEDKHLGVKTIPLVYGYKAAGWLTIVSLAIAVGLSLLIAPFVALNIVYLIGCSIAGIVLLMKPSLDLAKDPSPGNALSLFNKASLYPLIMLSAAVIAYYYRIIL